MRFVRVVGFAALLVAAPLIVVPAPALAQDSCAAVASRVRDTVSRAASREDAAAAFMSAAQGRPDCRDELMGLAQELQGQAQPEPDPPLGPVGWFWFTIYEDVFRRSALLMALFGWQMFLAPVLFVVTAFTVLRGATAGMRRPAGVPLSLFED